MAKVVVFVPSACADAVRAALAAAGAGRIGNYAGCSFSVRGVGRFRPESGATPFVGSVGTLEEVEEERIEAICPVALLPSAIAAIRAAHPYEEPAIEVYPMLDVTDR
jgi:hypothetical protein